MVPEYFKYVFVSDLLGSYGASAFSAVAGSFANSAVGTIASGAILGGVGSELTGGNFWQGAITDGFVAGFNHTFHIMKGDDPKKSVVAGIYGAGGDEAGDNPLLKEIVEGQGGTMFTDSWGGRDSEIIDFLKQGYSEGKQIKIYGYSRGGNSAIRIANELGSQGINVYELTTFDPHSLGGIHKLLYHNVKYLNNYYQQNPTDRYNALKGNWPTNPFWGRLIISRGRAQNINQINYSGQYYKSGVLVNHNNIISHVYGR